MNSRIVIVFAVCLMTGASAGCGSGGASDTVKTLCVNNLSMLWKLQYGHAGATHADSKLSSKTGSAFWLNLYEPSKTMKTPVDPKFLVCPASGKAPAKGFTTYRGPKADVNTLAFEDVVGCCSGHHGDGSITIVKKDGSAHLLNEGDPLYKKALAQTTK